MKILYKMGDMLRFNKRWCNVNFVRNSNFWRHFSSKALNIYRQIQNECSFAAKAWKSRNFVVMGRAQNCGQLVWRTNLYNPPNFLYWGKFIFNLTYFFSVSVKRSIMKIGQVPEWNCEHFKLDCNFCCYSAVKYYKDDNEFCSRRWQKVKFENDAICLVELSQI